MRPAGHRGHAGAPTWLPGFLGSHPSTATDSNETWERRKAVCSAQAGAAARQAALQPASLTQLSRTYEFKQRDPGFAPVFELSSVRFHIILAVH